jgi:hypothetical protein
VIRLLQKKIGGDIFAAMAMNIPKGQLVALGKILQYNQEKLDLLFEVFRDAKPALFIDDTIKGISGKLQISDKEAAEITRTLFSVYASRAALAHKINIEAFLRNICDALQASHSAPADGDWNKFKKFVVDFLGLKGAIELTSKALNVLMENERNCSAPRIITDLRPVFKENPADEPAGAVIVHTLKFDNREGRQEKEFFIALDSRDIHILKHAVERALIKEATLLALTAKMNLPVVRPDI